MSTMTIILIAIALLGVYFVMTYNTLIKMIESVRNNQKQIDIQLDRRFKVFESLINVVKNYMDYEKTTLSKVTELRNQAQAAHAAGDEKTRIAAEDSISRIATGISFVFEQYPDLKANQNALQLQEEVVNTENKLTFAKQACNDSIEAYNAKKKSLFPAVVVTLAPSKLDVPFEYWQLTTESIAEKEKYTVQL
ncbi:MAG: LemA family protein [Pseudomonadota bacterium]|nr:LemA family protein [Pseudomonadota bacterium]